MAAEIFILPLHREDEEGIKTIRLKEGIIPYIIDFSDPQTVHFFKCQETGVVDVYSAELDSLEIDGERPPMTPADIAPIVISDRYKASSVGPGDSGEQSITESNGFAKRIIVRNMGNLVLMPVRN